MFWVDDAQFTWYHLKKSLPCRKNMFLAFKTEVCFAEFMQKPLTVVVLKMSPLSSARKVAFCAFTQRSETWRLPPHGLCCRDLQVCVTVLPDKHCCNTTLLGYNASGRTSHIRCRVTPQLPGVVAPAACCNCIPILSIFPLNHDKMHDKKRDPSKAARQCLMHGNQVWVNGWNAL